MTAQLEQLQEKIAYLERDLEQIDEVVRTMADRMDIMGKTIEHLRSELKNRRMVEPGDTENDLPDVPPSHRGT